MLSGSASLHADWLKSERTTGACSCKCLLQIVHCLSSCGEKVLLDPNESS